MTSETEYRGYVIRHRHFSVPAGERDAGAEEGGSVRNLWMITAKASGFEVLAGLASSADDAKRQVDGLIEQDQFTVPAGCETVDSAGA